jgi:hypothetical protein
MTRKVNLEGFNHIEASKPSWDGSSTLTLWGRSPGGKAIAVNIKVSPISLGYIGRTVRKGLRMHEVEVAEAQRRMTHED